MSGRYPAGNYGVKPGEVVSVPVVGALDDGQGVVVLNALAGQRPLRFVGVHRIATPITITAPIADTMEQIFTTDSAVTIDNGRPVRPEWFGAAAGNIRLAVNALPATGGTIQLEAKRYPPAYSGAFGTRPDVDFLAKRNVRIIGRKTPAANADLSGLEGGTIIDGPFQAFADGFEAYYFGVDSGATVCAARYNGVAQEAFAFYKPGQAIGGNAKNVAVCGIAGICKGPAEPVHAVLMEGIDGLTFNDLHAYNGIHGVVVKSRHVNGVNVFAKGNGNEGLICKSDDYAPLQNVNIANVYCEPAGDAPDGGAGVIIEAQKAAGAQVQITNVQAVKKSTAVIIRSGGSILSDVQVSNVTSEGCTNGVAFDGDVRRVRVASVIVNNGDSAATISAATTNPGNEIDGITGTNLKTGIVAYGKMAIKHSAWDSVPGMCFDYKSADARLLVGSRVHSNATSVWPLLQALSGTWVNFGGDGNPEFSVLPFDGKVRLGGLIKGGGSPLIAVLSTQVRPVQNLRFMVHGFDGLNYVPVQIVVDTAGNVTATNFIAASSYISLDGIEYPMPV